MNCTKSIPIKLTGCSSDLGQRTSLGFSGNKVYVNGKEYADIVDTISHDGKIVCMTAKIKYGNAYMDGQLIEIKMLC